METFKPAGFYSDTLTFVKDIHSDHVVGAVGRPPRSLLYVRIVKDTKSCEIHRPQWLE